LLGKANYSGTITALGTGAFFGYPSATINGAGAAIIVVILLVSGESIAATEAGSFFSWFLGSSCHFYDFLHSLSR
jgi:hypothetical protein